jgi:hypothetical protein
LSKVRAKGDTQLIRPTCEVNLVYTDDGDRVQFTGPAFVADGGPEENLVGAIAARLLRVDDLGQVDALAQKADAPVDLAQAPLAVLVVGILAAIAVAGRP